MKKFNLFLIAITLIAVTLIIAAGCTKSSSSNSSSFTYTVSSLSNYTASEYVNTTFTVPITVTLASGTQGSLTLTPTGMPAGISVIPTTFVGLPTFTTDFVFEGTPTTSGTFPITVNAATASGTKAYTFNLAISAGSQFTYSVTGLPSNITLPQYTDTTISLPVTAVYGSGTSENVSLSASTPSAGITFTITPTSGTPPFTSTVAMNVAINTPGTYPVYINASAAGTATQAHTFNVIITSSADCSSEIASTTNYTTNTTCTGYTGTGTGAGSYPISSIGVTNEVRITTPFANLTGNLNCSAGTLTTDTTSTLDLNIAPGTGTFSPSTVVVTYSITNSLTTTCTTTYTR